MNAPPRIPSAAHWYSLLGMSLTYCILARGLFQFLCIIKDVVQLLNVVLGLFLVDDNWKTLVGRIEIQTANGPAIIVIRKNGKIRLGIAIGNSLAVQYLTADRLYNIEAFKFFFCSLYLRLIFFNYCNILLGPRILSIGGRGGRAFVCTLQGNVKSFR